MSERGDAIRQTMADIRAIEATEGVTANGVAVIRERLLALTARRELFPPDAYPAPGVGEELKSRLYRLAQDPDDRFALYVNASRGGVATPAHNHTTWAVVVGFAGAELNRFYRRTEAGVEQTGEHLVEAGTGVAMLPDDLHSIRIDGPALNFHCYGLALERQDQRQFFHAASGEWRPFTAHGDIRDARDDQVRC